MQDETDDVAMLFWLGADFPDTVPNDAPFDAVILWHAYATEGIENRDQLDHYLQVPDLHAVVAKLQARGVKVHLAYHPWVTADRTSFRVNRQDIVSLSCRGPLAHRFVRGVVCGFRSLG